MLEQTVYPRLERDPTPQLLAKRFTPTPEEVRFVDSMSPELESRLCAMLLLKCFQHVRQFPQMKDIPPVTVAHVRMAMRLGVGVVHRYKHLATPSRQRAAIRRFMGIAGGDVAGRDIAVGAMRAGARSTSEVTRLIDIGVQALLAEPVELPAFATMVRLARSAKTEQAKRMLEFGLTRGELKALLGNPSDGTTLRDIAGRALARVEAKLKQLTRTRTRLRAVLRGGVHLDRSVVLEALCNDTVGESLKTERSAQPQRRGRR